MHRIQPQKTPIQTSRILLPLTKRFQSTSSTSTSLPNTSPSEPPTPIPPPPPPSAQPAEPKQEEVKKGSRKALFFLLLAVPAIYLSSVLGRLNREYPLHTISPLSDPTNPIFQTSDSSRYIKEQVRVIKAKVSLSALLPTPFSDDGTLSPAQREQNYAELWTSTFFSTPTIQLEGKLFGLLFLRKGWTAGDVGDSPDGLHEEQQLLNGIFVIKSIQKDSVSVEWKVSDGIVSMIENAVEKYNLPYRIMSGGRHVLGATQDGIYVDVTFGCGVDYERVNRSTGKDDGKRVPKVLIWFHEMYARWLVDAAIYQLKKKGTAGWD